jgi:LPXTG-site transpeptidase (sortase) family protein
LQGTAWVDVPGNIALGGHSEYPDGTPGIFNGLYGVNIGDPIYLNVNGSQRRYIVTEKRSVRFDDLSVVYPTTSERLTLITCDIPSYDAGTSFYWERLVVVAVPG